MAGGCQRGILGYFVWLSQSGSHNSRNASRLSLKTPLSPPATLHCVERENISAMRPTITNLKASQQETYLQKIQAQQGAILRLVCLEAGEKQVEIFITLNNCAQYDWVRLDAAESAYPVPAQSLHVLLQKFRGVQSALAQLDNNAMWSSESMDRRLRQLHPSYRSAFLAGQNGLDASVVSRRHSTPTTVTRLPISNEDLLSAQTVTSVATTDQPSEGNAPSSASDKAKIAELNRQITLLKQTVIAEQQAAKQEKEIALRSLYHQIVASLPQPPEDNAILRPPSPSLLECRRIRPYPSPETFQRDFFSGPKWGDSVNAKTVISIIRGGLKSYLPAQALQNDRPIKRRPIESRLTDIEKMNIKAHLCEADIHSRFMGVFEHFYAATSSNMPEGVLIHFDTDFLGEPAKTDFSLFLYAFWGHLGISIQQMKVFIRKNPLLARNSSLKARLTAYETIRNRITNLLTQEQHKIFYGLSAHGMAIALLETLERLEETLRGSEATKNLLLPLSTARDALLESLSIDINETTNLASTLVPLMLELLAKVYQLDNISAHSEKISSSVLPKFNLFYSQVYEKFFLLKEMPSGQKNVVYEDRPSSLGSDASVDASNRLGFAPNDFLRSLFLTMYFPTEQDSPVYLWAMHFFKIGVERFHSLEAGIKKALTQSGKTNFPKHSTLIRAFFSKLDQVVPEALLGLDDLSFLDWLKNIFKLQAALNSLIYFIDYLTSSVLAGSQLLEEQYKIEKKGTKGKCLFEQISLLWQQVEAIEDFKQIWPPDLLSLCCGLPCQNPLLIPASSIHPSFLSVRPVGLQTLRFSAPRSPIQHLPEAHLDSELRRGEEKASLVLALGCHLSFEELVSEAQASQIVDDSNTHGTTVNKANRRPARSFQPFEEKAQVPSSLFRTRTPPDERPNEEMATAAPPSPTLGGASQASSLAPAANHGDQISERLQGLRPRNLDFSKLS